MHSVAFCCPGCIQLHSVAFISIVLHWLHSVALCCTALHSIVILIHSSTLHYTYSIRMLCSALLYVGFEYLYSAFLEHLKDTVEFFKDDISLFYITHNPISFNSITSQDFTSHYITSHYIKTLLLSRINQLQFVFNNATRLIVGISKCVHILTTCETRNIACPCEEALNLRVLC